MAATLYGVGIGPGDPELMTLKAARLLKTCPVVFTVISANVDESVSERAVRSLDPSGEIIRLAFSMSKDREVRRRVVEENARKVIERLAKGQDCVYATLGDTLSYSTFGYVLPLVKAALPDVNVDIVPGITSWSTLAARAGVVLAENGDVLKVVPSFRKETAENLVFTPGTSTVLLKTYRSRRALLDRLRKEKDVDVVYGENLTRGGEFVATSLDDIEAREETYLSLMLVRKRAGDA